MAQLRQPTIIDVAALAGVSRQTVSRVLNEKGEISEETRGRVLAAMKSLGYRPNAAARSLMTGRTQSIGLILPDVTNPFFLQIVAGVEDRARSEGYSVILSNTAEDPTRERESLLLLQDKRVDGIIWAGTRLPDADLDQAARYLRAGVLLNRSIQGINNLGFLKADFFRGTYLAVRHLLELGHRRIAMFNSVITTQSGEEKEGGYLQALGEYGINPPPDWIIKADPHAPGGLEAVEKLLTLCPEVTAVITGGDLLAVGALMGCKERGHRVPEDLAVVGFGGTPFGSITSPSLSTVSLPLLEMGEAAVDLLLEIIRGEVPDPRPLFEPRLLLRESSGTHVQVPSMAKKGG